MKKYTEKEFEFHELTGISEKTMEIHLALYSGYVKNTNTIIDLTESMKGDDSKKYELLEARRRFSFEFGGMRNHEYFFEQLTGGKQELNSEGELAKKMVEDFGSVKEWRENFRGLANMRGVGFAILNYDHEQKRLVNNWIDEQHIGHLNGTRFIFGVDLWEHAYILDYVPSEKSSYVDTIFENTNFGIVENRYQNAI